MYQSRKVTGNMAGILSKKGWNSLNQLLTKSWEGLKQQILGCVFRSVQNWVMFLHSGTQAVGNSAIWSVWFVMARGREQGHRKHCFLKLFSSDICHLHSYFIRQSKSNGDTYLQEAEGCYPTMHLEGGELQQWWANLMTPTGKLFNFLYLPVFICNNSTVLISQGCQSVK